MLASVEWTSEQIRKGRVLLLAGSEDALRRLPEGDWIAGTIPYFVDREKGGVCSTDQIFVTEVPACAMGAEICRVAAPELPGLLESAPDNGYTVLILPYGSPAHVAWAHDAISYADCFVKPVVGWVAGVHVSEIGRRQAKVFDGRTRQSTAEQAVAMHVTLAPGSVAEIEIVNVFRPAVDGAAVQFPQTGFAATNCLVDGVPANFARFLRESNADPKLPLTADYNGSVINVSIQSIDDSNGSVSFYAPVFAGVEYRFAAPVGDYVQAFHAAAGSGDSKEPVFSCNCILNYLYSELEGKKTGSATGPMTFGEIANLLLNQTLVRLHIRD